MRNGTTWNPWQELDGFRREVSALLGGGPRWGNDWAEGIDVDAAGNVYFTGATDSPNFPTTGGQGAGGATHMSAVVVRHNLTKLQANE